MKKLLLLVGESGCGKSTLMKNLLGKYPLRYHLILSTTTRPPREGEYDGIDYNFKTHEQYHELLNKEVPVQETSFSGNRYATFPSDYEREDREVGVLAVVPKHIDILSNHFKGKKQIKHVFFNTSNELLKKHLSNLPEEKAIERIERGHIREDYLKSVGYKRPQGALWLRDCDIDENLHIVVNQYVEW